MHMAQLPIEPIVLRRKLSDEDLEALNNAFSETLGCGCCSDDAELRDWLCQFFAIEFEQSPTRFIRSEHG